MPALQSRLRMWLRSCLLIAVILVPHTLVANAGYAATPVEPVLPREPVKASSGFYLSAGYAMVYSPDEHIAFDNTASSGRALLDYDLGFRAASLALGYRFANGFRTELETSYRRNELELIEFPPPTGFQTTGHKDSVDAFTTFANLYYEVDIKRAWTPYVGAGIGIGSVGYKGNSAERQGFTVTESPLFDERDSALVWQLIAGLSLPFTPRTRLSAEYRYTQSGDLNFDATTDDGISTSYKTRHKLHMAGLQLQFFPGANRNIYYSSNRPSRLAPTLFQNWYVAGQFGVVAAEDSDLKDSSVDTNFDAFDLGAAASLSVGTRFNSRKRQLPLRVELEALHFSTDADLVDFGKLGGEFRLRGPAKTSALALNLIAERPRRFGITPYAGIGLGYAKVDYDVHLRAPQPGYADQRFLTDDATSPLIQALLGVNLRISEGWDLTLGYRYWWAPLLELDNPAGEPIETEHSAHTIQLGLVWRH